MFFQAVFYLGGIQICDLGYKNSPSSGKYKVYMYIYILYIYILYVKLYASQQNVQMFHDPGWWLLQHRFCS